MTDHPKWIPEAESECMRHWAEYLHREAKRLMTQDGTHACMLFLFNKENGLISVDLVPPNTDGNQINEAVAHAVYEHGLYGVILIGETWSYFMKENDHTAFQLLDGEMKVSDLNAEDKKEALMLRMENGDGDCLIYLNEMVRDEHGVTLKEDYVTSTAQRNWFVHQEDMLN